MYLPRPANQDLDPLARLDVHKRLLRILESHLPRNQPLGINLARRHQLHRQLVVATAVAKAALDRQLLRTRRRDGEGDLLLAHPGLDICAACPKDMDPGLNRRLCATRVQDDVGATPQLVLSDQVSGVLLRRDRLRLVRRCRGEFSGEF